MKAGRILSGLLLVALGVVLLLNNYGLVDWSVWLEIGKWWPMLLIIFGVAIFFDRSLLPLGIVLLILALFFGLITLSPTGKTGIEPVVDQHSWAIDPNITEAGLEVELPAGDLSIRESSQNKVEFTLKYPHGKPARVKQEIKGRKAYYKIQSTKSSFLDGLGKNSAGELNLTLSPEVSWDVELEVGTAKAELDFSQLKLKKLEVECGASELQLQLGRPEPETLVNIEAGASRLKIVVPEDVRLQIRSDGILSNSNLEAAGLIRSGDVYYTPDSVSSDSVLKIELDTGVSDLELVRSRLY